MATRSPSPNPSRPKTPESTNSLRKSKEIPQRKSSASLHGSFEHKENEKDPSFSKPGVQPRPKNFMAPTVSAVSKAVAAPSPRKRILQERNEVITNPVSDSFEFPVKEIGYGVVEINDVGSQSETGFCSHEVLVESRIKNHQNQNLVVPSISSLPCIAPLDADPSRPPYDPKTNYLSPRPQFLLYRPNPRIESYLDREGELLDFEGDGRKLEDSFSFESDGEEDVVAVDPEEKDLEVDENDESFHSDEKSLSESLVTEPEFQAKPLKRRPFRISKSVSFLLVLVLAYLNLPLLDSPMLKDDQSLPNIRSSGVFEDLHLRFKHWSTDSIAYLTSLTSSPKDDVRFYNVTPSVVDEPIGSEFVYKPEIATERAIEETEAEEEGDAEFYAEEIEIGSLDEYSEIEAENMEVLASENEKEDEIDTERIEMEVFEEGDAEYKAKEIEVGSLDEYSDIKAEDLKEDEAVTERIEMEVPEDVIDANEIEKETIVEDVVNEAKIIVNEEESIDAASVEPLKSINYKTTLGLSLAILLLASTFVLYKKKEQTAMAKKVGSISGNSETYKHPKGSPEVTSSWNNTSSSSDQNQTKRVGEDRNLSHEKRLRRDSAASSSISYGSFTTYEKLSAKKGNIDEEVVTPVRRSSRIWNQITSP